jgi:hypothetical protein
MDRDRDPRTRLAGNASSAEAGRPRRRFLRATARSAATLSAFGFAGGLRRRRDDADQPARADAATDGRCRRDESRDE